MSKRFTYYGGSAFDPSILNGDLIFDAGVDVYSDTGITPATNGQLVTQINNQGVGLTSWVAEAVVSSKATYYTGGLGGNPYLQVSHGNVTAYQFNTGVSQGAAFELFLVMETITGTASNNVQVVFNTENNTGRGYCRFDFGSPERLLVSVGLGAGQVPCTFVDGTRYIINIRRNASNLITFTLDGVDLGTATHTPAFNVGKLFGRADQAYKYYYGFMKTSELTATERSQMYNYLDSKY